jgi:hypothetical protein
MSTPYEKQRICAAGAPSPEKRHGHARSDKVDEPMQTECSPRHCRDLGVLAEWGKRAGFAVLPLASLNNS